MLLTGAERKLCRHVRAGRPVEFSHNESIRAEVLRRIVLGLRFNTLDSCSMTAVGIAVKGATIVERLRLDSAGAGEGGAVSALEFRECTFAGGFSGAHAHFGRLSFSKCRFRDPSKGADPDLATIDLADTAVDGDLDFTGIRPEGELDLLWVRANGARIDGKVDLSEAQLRAPPPNRERSIGEEERGGLLLELADVHGELLFLRGAHSKGMIHLGGAHIRGDVWMTGATVVSRDRALFFQDTTIDGHLMLDGRVERADRPDSFRRFTCVGTLNLTGVRVGGNLELRNFDVRARSPADPEAPGLSLAAARIAMSLRIGSNREKPSTLEGSIFANDLTVGMDVVIDGVKIGAHERFPAISVHSMRAAQVVIKNVEGLLREGGKAEQLNRTRTALSLNLQDVRAERVEIASCTVSGEIDADSLQCKGDVILEGHVGRRLDLSGCIITGTLDLSDLRMDPSAEGMDLKDGEIGGALRLIRLPDTKDRPPPKLLAARRAPLQSLPGLTLIETVWSVDAPKNLRPLAQVGFVTAGQTVYRLDGDSGIFHDLVRLHHCDLSDEETAGEYLRLHCAYAQGDEGALRILTADGGTPPMLDIDREASGKVFRKLAEKAEADQADATELARLEQLKRRLRSPSLAVLGRELFTFEPECHLPGSFIVDACVLYGNRLSRDRFRLDATRDKIDVSVEKEEPLDIIVRGAPVFRAQFAYHPKGSKPGETDPFVTESTIAGMERVKDVELRALQAKFASYVESPASLQGKVDLTGLDCDMLDDQAGRFWGRHLRIEMDHFAYKRTTWLEPEATKRGWLARFGDQLRRVRAERTPPWLAEWRGWTERLQLHAYSEPWRIRRNWIYQQYDTSKLPAPSQYRIRDFEYRPQPLEQAINVARVEGREEYALNFEVLKEKIEWDIFLTQNRGWFLFVGLVASLLSLTVAGYRNPQTALAGMVVVLLLVASFPYVANFVMHWGFGYLRRPIRAIITLILAFLLGWLGVSTANREGMLVIDVEPVASLVGQGQDAAIIGSEREQDSARLASNIPCGHQIDEPLYALDVLIPLIDLRQESRCEVGRAESPPEQWGLREAAARGTTRQPAQESDSRFWRRVHAVWRTVMGAPFDPVTGWSVLKAFYAIAGWFIVSLAILTFAHITRPRPEPR